MELKLITWNVLIFLIYCVDACISSNRAFRSKQSRFGLVLSLEPSSFSVHMISFKSPLKRADSIFIFWNAEILTVTKDRNFQNVVKLRTGVNGSSYSMPCIFDKARIKSLTFCFTPGLLTPVVHSLSLKTEGDVEILLDDTGHISFPVLFFRCDLIFKWEMFFYKTSFIRFWRVWTKWLFIIKDVSNRSRCIATIDLKICNNFIFSPTWTPQFYNTFLWINCTWWFWISLNVVIFRGSRWVQSYKAVCILRPRRDLSLRGESSSR